MIVEFKAVVDKMKNFFKNDKIQNIVKKENIARQSVVNNTINNDIKNNINKNTNINVSSNTNNHVRNSLQPPQNITVVNSNPNQNVKKVQVIIC